MEYPKRIMMIAVTPDLGYGFEGGLPWPLLTADMKHFKKVTQASKEDKELNVVLMGRKTWDSIPAKYRPLPGRINAVVSSKNRDEFMKSGGSNSVLLYGSVEKANGDFFRENHDPFDTVFVIGGEKLWNGMGGDRLEAYDEIYVTRIEKEYECDVFMKNLNDDLESGFTLVSEDHHLEKDVPYHIQHWKRKEEDKEKSPPEKRARKEE